MKGEFTPERLAARAEIEHVMNCWCRAVDRRDMDGVRAVFHPDGFDDHGLFRGGVEELVAFLTERHKTISRSMHLVTNMLIEFSDDDNALAETYNMGLQRYSADGAATRSAITGGANVTAGAFDMLATGRYVDHFQRRDGAWRILHRTVIIDNMRIMPLTDAEPKMGADWSVSARDASDPLWALRRSFGLTGGR